MKLQLIEAGKTDYLKTVSGRKYKYEDKYATNRNTQIRLPQDRAGRKYKYEHKYKHTNKTT